MATLSSSFEEETNNASSTDELKDDAGVGEGEGEELRVLEKGEEQEEENDESAAQKQQRKPAWAPCFYNRVGREVYTYVGQEIFIEEGFDSYAGMIWPAACVLCQYLDTHRQQMSMVDKAVLEIGAGTGLVSIVASLLGAWVTATDLPEVLNNLRVNLSRNTKWLCRHTPQVAALSWGYDLEQTYPSSVYRYDYVLAADVVYHHDFRDELLFTMKHFCQPGTKLIWANKVRFGTDLTFTENFKKAFNTSLLLEDGEMKIFMATCREQEEEGDGIQDMLTEMEEIIEEEEDEEPPAKTCEDKEKDVPCENHISMPEREDQEKEKTICQFNEEEEEEEEEDEEEDEEGEDEEDDEDKEEENISRQAGLSEVGEDKKEESRCSSGADDLTAEEAQTEQTAAQQDTAPAWVPTFNSRLDRDVYHYVGKDIVIQESIDSFGAVMWPGALALCSFLENNREKVNLQGKQVLELGAGTGLVSIVASLLGASVTATDLPDVLGNLRANVMRNTRGLCRYTPQIAVLSWGYDLKYTHPISLHHYDYILAADVVYHHDFLDELLFTMKYFCQPGTKLIWANKVRFVTDLTFTENFKRTFDTTVLVEEGEMKIFMATCRK